MPTHITLGRSVGLSEAHLAGLANEELPDPPFSPTERLVIRYARQLTRVEPIDDDLYGGLQGTFTLPQIMELCFTVGLANVVNRFHATFHTPLDERTRAAFADGSPLELPDEPASP